MSEDNFHAITDVSWLPLLLREDLQVPAIKDTNYETFIPTIKDPQSAVVSGIEQDDMFTLDGFYGVKAKNDAEVILMGQYTPIYARWKFGFGAVGTFACDLNGTWSSELVSSQAGVTLINNIVRDLFPTQDIRPEVIDVTIIGDNYDQTVTVSADFEEGEYIDLVVISPAGVGDSSVFQIFTANAVDGRAVFEFEITTCGVHEIIVQKNDASGLLVAERICYKALSYSKKYDCFVDMDAAEENAALLAQNGRGEVIKEGWEVYENVAQFLHKVIDPRLGLIIAVIVLLLMDIAVRKFKWKWPHEIIQERKAKQAMSAINE
jgi:hypothetical protein